MGSFLIRIGHRGDRSISSTPMIRRCAVVARKPISKILGLPIADEDKRNILAATADEVSDLARGSSKTCAGYPTQEWAVADQQ